MPRKTTSKGRDRVSKLIGEVETAAKQLRKDIRKRAEETGSGLKKTAQQLAKRAATVAALVEKQVHQLRKDLEKTAKPKRPATSKAKRKASIRKTKTA